MSNFEKVREFHEAFGMPVNEAWEYVSPDRAKLRLDLIVEELDELFEATLGLSRGTVSDLIWDGLKERGENESDSIGGGSVAAFSTVGVADALVDMLYVTYGACLEFGINADAVFDEIHKSNMSKLGADGKPIYREDGKVLKGPDFFEPNIVSVLVNAQ